MSSGAQKLRDKLRSSQKTKDPSEKFDVRVSVNEHVAAVLKKLKEKEVISLTLCILMDFPIHIDTISMGLPIVRFKGSQVEFSKF